MAEEINLGKGKAIQKHTCTHAYHKGFEQYTIAHAVGILR